MVSPPEPAQGVRAEVCRCMYSARQRRTPISARCCSNPLRPYDTLPTLPAAATHWRLPAPAVRCGSARLHPQHNAAGPLWMRAAGLPRSATCAACQAWASASLPTPPCAAEHAAHPEQERAQGEPCAEAHAGRRGGGLCCGTPPCPPASSALRSVLQCVLLLHHAASMPLPACMRAQGWLPHAPAAHLRAGLQECTAACRSCPAWCGAANGVWCRSSTRTSACPSPGTTPLAARRAARCAERV